MNDRDESHWIESWIDEVKLMMKSRNTAVHSNQNSELSATKNKIIIECAREFSERIEYNKETLTILNHMRMFKKVFSPCKLIGGSGRDETEVFKDNSKESQMRWTFCLHEIDKPSRKAFKIWRTFIAWLKKQEIKTTCDFNDYAHCAWTLSEDQKVLIVNNVLSKEVYVSEDEKACEK